MKTNWQTIEHEEQQDWALYHLITLGHGRWLAMAIHQSTRIDSLEFVARAIGAQYETSSSHVDAVQPQKWRETSLSNIAS
jgi:hypothetical protein